MTVDSEAIFALAEATENRAEALEQLSGAMATAWVDERRPGCSSSPAAWAGRSGSARGHARALLRLDPARAGDRRALRRRQAPASARCPRARCSRSPTAASPGRERFRPDITFVEDDALPAIRTPDEGAHCLRRLASLVQPRIVR